MKYFTVAEAEALPFAPKMVNIKPSRIGSLRALCATYDYCEEHGIGAYGGGQNELGVGRGQAQYLAALFHAEFHGVRVRIISCNGQIPLKCAHKSRDIAGLEYAADLFRC